MQKLERRNTYTPTGIPHTCSNCDLSLNVEETLCVAGLKTFSNNSDAALTGLGESSRAKPAGTCYKNHLNLLNNRIRGQGRYLATTNARGTLPPCPKEQGIRYPCPQRCLLYTSDAADDLLCVDLGGRRIIKKKK